MFLFFLAYTFWYLGFTAVIRVQLYIYTLIIVCYDTTGNVSQNGGELIHHHVSELVTRETPQLKRSSSYYFSSISLELRDGAF